METDQPTPNPDHLVARVDAPSPPPRRRGSMFGLPARLALLVLAAVAVCVAGLAWYADGRIQEAARDQAVASAADSAQTALEQIGASDFSELDAPARKALNARLEQIRHADPSIKSIALFTKSGDGVERVDASSKGDGGASLAKQSIADGDEVSSLEGASDDQRVRIAWPVRFDGKRVVGVVVVESLVDPAAAITASSRRTLLLGALLGGSLLGVLVLVLLRRELFRPLEEMRRVMAQIRGGAKGVRIGWSRSDELGAVADDFDAMVSQLEEAEAELARFVNRDPLTGLLTREAFTDRFSGELTRARREGYPISLLAIDVDDLADLNRTHDEQGGDQILAAIGEVISSCTRPTDACGRVGGDSFHVALVGADAVQAAVVVQRIRREIAQRVGIGPERTRVTCGYGVAEYPTHAVDQIALERMADAACAHAQRDGRDRALAFGPAGGYVDAGTLVPEEQRDADRPAGERELASTVHALARALDGIDPALGGGAHSQRVARYAAAVARELGFGDSALRELRSAAVLHDIGKVAVPPSILRAPEESLDDRQRGALRYHAWVSRTMIAGAGLAPVADIVFHLPERWDGTGYPERAREDAIPVASRILHAAELLDQLTTGHAGREPMSGFDAASELKRRAGTELDPDIAVRLARMVREEGLLGRADDEAAAAPAAPEQPLEDAA